MAEGRAFSVLAKNRQPTPWSGEYLVVVDSGRTRRPPWSPNPLGGKNSQTLSRSRETVRSYHG